MKKITRLLSLNIFFILSNTFLYANTDNSLKAKTSIKKETQQKQRTNTSKQGNIYDFDMLKAADLLVQGKFSEASMLYEKLYNVTREAYFLKQIALAQSQAGNLTNALNFALKYQEESKDNEDIETNFIIAENHIRKKENNLAIILLERVAKINPNPRTHYILSNLYMQQKMPNEALKYLIKIYDDEMSIGSKIKLDALNQIVAIYLQQEKIDTALEYLNRYIVSNEYPVNLQNFVELYAKTKKLDILKDNLHKRFLAEQNIENLRMLIAILVELKLHKEAIVILKKYANIFDDDLQEILMQVYADNGNFKEAMNIARMLYTKTNRLDLLGLSAVYEFESIKHKNTKTLEPVLSKIQELIQKRAESLKQTGEKPTKDDAFFYNFLGYALIDYNIDIDSGLEYVRQALAIEPNSIEYLDSLAWGFYKKNDCKQAKETMKLIPQDKLKMFPELILHYEAITKCVIKDKHTNK